MLRVNPGGVLVVPPFDCAWLTGEAYTLRNGTGCIAFEAKGDTDVTVILKSTPGAKRLQPLLRSVPNAGGSGNALHVEQNYTIIFGSHRNSCLKIEKNGVTQCMVTGVPCSRVSSKVFSKYWIDLNHGVLTVGQGEPGEGVYQQWRDAQEIPGIQHIGLSCWDRHVSYRSISLHPALDFTRLQQQQQRLGAGSEPHVPPLFDATVAAIMASTTPANVCSALAVAELLLPTTQKLYRYCLDYIARHFRTVVRDHTEGLRGVSAAAMCDLVCQNAFSVDEAEIFSAVRNWAAHCLAQAGTEGAEEGQREGGEGGGQAAGGQAGAAQGAAQLAAAVAAGGAAAATAVAAGGAVGSAFAAEEAMEAPCVRGGAASAPAASNEADEAVAALAAGALPLLRIGEVRGVPVAGAVPGCAKDMGPPTPPQLGGSPRPPASPKLPPPGPLGVPAGAAGTAAAGGAGGPAAAPAAARLDGAGGTGAPVGSAAQRPPAEPARELPDLRRASAPQLPVPAALLPLSGLPLPPLPPAPWTACATAPAAGAAGHSVASGAASSGDAASSSVGASGSAPAGAGAVGRASLDYGLGVGVGLGGSSASSRLVGLGWGPGSAGGPSAAPYAPAPYAPAPLPAGGAARGAPLLGTRSCELVPAGAAAGPAGPSSAMYGSVSLPPGYVLDEPGAAGGPDAAWDRAAVGGADGGASAEGAEVLEAVVRVLSLIRFPLLPIARLHACLEDPLLRRLPPAVMSLVHEALEVHVRETGAGAWPGGGGEAGSQGPAGDAGGGAWGQQPQPQRMSSASGGALAGGTQEGSGAGGSVGPPARSCFSPVGGGGQAAAASAFAGASQATAAGPGSFPACPDPLAPASSAGPSCSTSAPTPGTAATQPAASGPASTSAAPPSALLTATSARAPPSPAPSPVGLVDPAGAWSVRYQRRCLPFALELMFVCDGDQCGVLHFLGTQYGSQGWVNPMLAKRVDVRASSPTGRTTDPRVIAGRQFVRTNFAGPRYVNGVASSWWQLDLGEQHQLAITHYTMRHDGSTDYVRHWVLQGSSDLTTWVDLKRHANDTSIKLPGQYGSWPVIGPAAAAPYRAFRLLLTGPNASPNASSRTTFPLSNLELYGYLYKGGNAAGSSEGGAAPWGPGGGVAGPVAGPAGGGGGAAGGGVGAVVGGGGSAAGGAGGATGGGGGGGAVSCAASAVSSGGGGGAMAGGDTAVAADGAGAGPV